MEGRTLGKVIRFYRLMQEMTEKQLAEKCGVAPSTIYLVETKNTCADKTLAKISQVLNIEYSYLVDLKKQGKRVNK